MAKSLAAAVLIGATCLLAGQASDPNGTQVRPGERGKEQTMRGVLMDSTCAAIASQHVSSTRRADATRTQTRTSERRRSTTSAGAEQHASAPKQSQEASRTAEQSAGKEVTTVRQKYASCRVTPATTAFALHTSGELYVLDQEGNDIVRQQMGNEAFRAGLVDDSGGPRWMSVTVVGTPTSDGRLSVRSVRK